MVTPKQDGMCVRVWLTRFAVQQELAQHREAAMLQSIMHPPKSHHVNPQPNVPLVYKLTKEASPVMPEEMSLGNI